MNLIGMNTSTSYRLQEFLDNLTARTDKIDDKDLVDELDSD